jgi:hypothetical protein
MPSKTVSMPTPNPRSIGASSNTTAAVPGHRRFGAIKNWELCVESLHLCGSVQFEVEFAQPIAFL